MNDKSKVFFWFITYIDYSSYLQVLYILFYIISFPAKATYRVHEGWISLFRLISLSKNNPNIFISPYVFLQVICSYFNNTGLTDKELLTSIFRGISVYFNGTGTAKCLNWQTDPSTDISEIAWDIQVFITAIFCVVYLKINRFDFFF